MAYEAAFTKLDFVADAEIRAQGFVFKANLWRTRVGDLWPTYLDSLPTARTRPGYQWISRQDVFDLASESTTRAGAQLLVAAYVWGTGDANFLIGRRAQVFTKNDHDVIVDRLAAAYAVLASEGPVMAYASLSWGGSNKLTYLGPSFFTKVLYFAGYPTSFAGPKPLILDQFVAVGLNDVMGWSLSERGPWSTADYDRYTGLATKFATELDVEPHAVECALFTHGRALKKRAAGRRSDPGVKIAARANKAPSR